MIPFLTDSFETVDTAFWFDFGPCNGEPASMCEDIDNVRDVVVVIGEKIKATDSSKTYGYITYKLRDDGTIEELPKSFSHLWGLSNQGTFRGKFWPLFKRDGSLIIGSAFNREHQTLYLLVTEIDENSNPINRVYTRHLEQNGWSQWTIFAANKLNGMFTVGGDVYVVDTDSNIKSYEMEKNGLIDKKTVVNKLYSNSLTTKPLFQLIAVFGERVLQLYVKH